MVINQYIKYIFQVNLLQKCNSYEQGAQMAY